MDADFLIAIWEGRITKKVIDKIIASGRYGSKHIFAQKCLDGDTKMLCKLVDKLFANKQAVEVNSAVEDTAEIAMKLNELIDDVRLEAFNGQEVVSV